MNSLELIKLNKHYGRKHALKNFSFTFTNGIYGLLGPNGAGKSTLMHLITGILHPDKGGGSINWNGKPIHQLGKSYREHLGFMPQQQEFRLCRQENRRLFRRNETKTFDSECNFGQSRFINTGRTYCRT